MTSRKIPETGSKIAINGDKIERVDNTKFLGIYFDESLTWANHIKIIANKVATNVGKISHLLSTKILNSLYFNMINRYLTYGNIVWAPNYVSSTHCLSLLQKGAIRVIVGDKYNAHTIIRFKELDIMKF